MSQEEDRPMDVLRSVDLFVKVLRGEYLADSERDLVAALIDDDPNLLHDVCHVEAHAAGLECPCVGAGHGCHFESAEDAAEKSNPLEISVNAVEAQLRETTIADFVCSQCGDVEVQTDWEFFDGAKFVRITGAKCKKCRDAAC